MQEEEKTIPQMVDDFRTGKLPRRRFIKTLTAMGISAAGVSAIAAAAASHAFASAPTLNHSINKRSNLLELHDTHLANQQQGNIDDLHNDYALDAVVEDSMHPHPFIGRQAIMARKGVGMAAIPGLQINVTSRVVRGNQVSVEWVATGKHTGDLPGLPASGRSFSIPGVTVVVRHNGKITHESIFYDVAEVRRQLSAK
jgi:steroid delta-isomerase-like uncharacterized protein